MFQLLAIITALGATDPTMTLRSNHAFADEVACKAYLDTDMGKLDKVKLDAMVARATEETGTQYKVELTCKAAKSDGNGDI
jgi:hypothetical protein